MVQVEKGGLRSLGAADLERLPSLYRTAVGSLSVARAISLDRNLLDYLNALVARAYLCVYGTKAGAGETFRGFFRRRFPAAVRAHAPFLAAAVFVFSLGLLTGWRLMMLSPDNPERYYSLVDQETAQGRDPLASTAELREVLQGGGAAGGARLSLFATVLFTHNAKIGILCFALGFAGGLPVLYLLFANGLTLGALAALYQSRGLGLEFWAWLLPHGVTELTAVCLCGAAGLVLGTSLIFPGPHTRLHNLARRGRRASVLILGAVALFLIAGLIEAFFRQQVESLALRWLVASGTLAFWTVYFLFAGRER